MAEIWLTEEEVEKRKQKLEYMKSTRRLEIAEMLKIARGFGDLSENAEYDAAKIEQAKNEYDIATLEDELSHVRIIDESMLSTGGVSIGSTVTIRNAMNGMEMTYQIVGTAESDPRNGRISNESPIGGALLGHVAGDTVEVHTPGGVLSLEIININAGR